MKYEIAVMNIRFHMFPRLLYDVVINWSSFERSLIVAFHITEQKTFRTEVVCKLVFWNLAQSTLLQ